MKRALRSFARRAGHRAAEAKSTNNAWGDDMSEVVANGRIRKAVRALLCGFPVASLATLALPAQAQQAPANQPEDQLQEVVVTGLRASLQQSLDIKREATGVVDAISAEDIGKFPDANLAEAMGRVPGVTISRAAEGQVAGVGGSTGAATQVTVRGFGPQFNETLFDGRQVPTSTGDRGFDFGALGSDLVGQLDVMKTPDASLSSGAIGATINIKFPKPFDHPGFHVAGALSGQESTGASKVTPNGSVLISDTFADDRFGILLAGAYDEIKTRGNHINIQGWEGANGANNAGLEQCQLKGSGPCASAVTGGSITDWFIQDYGIYQEHNDDKRIGGRLVVQARPVDGLEITLDDNFSRQTLTQEQQGFSAWFSNTGLTDVVQAADGTVTSFTQPNTATDFQAAINGSVVRNNTTGLNVKWQADEHNSFMFDAYTASSKLNPGGQLSQLDADVGYGSAATYNSLGIVVPGGENLPYPVNYGPAGNAASFTDPGIIGSHVMVIESKRNSDTINQFKLEGVWEDDNTKLKYGVQFTHDAMAIRDYTDLPYTWQMYSGYGTGGGISPMPANLISSTFSTGPGFISGWGNGANLPANIIAANGYAIKDYLESLNGAGMNVGNCSNLTGSTPCTGTYLMYESPGAHQDITEKTLAPYVNLAALVNIGHMPLHISLGARWEDTKVDSAGLGQLPTALITPGTGDVTLYTMTLTDVVAVDKKNEYRYLLPSLDLNLGITDEIKARLDVSRTLTRPPLNYLTPTVNIPAGQRIGSLNGTGGNPDLLPYLSDNIDLGAEWYYARNSYVSIDAFVKELSNFIVGGTVTQSVNGVTLPALNAYSPGGPNAGGALAMFAITSQVNGPSAEVRGIELGIQHMFWDTGFGFSANATFVGTNRPYDPYDTSTSGFAVTGLANSWNFVPFYEKYGFMIRLALNHQAEFLNNFGQHQPNSNFGAEPVFVNGSTYLDLSAAYDINAHLSVFAGAQNLTHEVFSTHGRFKEQLLDVVDTGRSFNLGMHFKF